jgi:predicted nucleotidyltransferase
MNTQIQHKLKEIEAQHQLKILYACETGSRAWGFPSPDSDYDVRMIYVHEADWYLTLSDKKDTIEFMSEDAELDITGWDIKKCLKLMWKSNGALLERLQSPIIYREENGLQPVLQQFSQRCFAPIAAMHHYLGMARNSFFDIEGKEEIKLKKLFYALRATLCCKWILEKGTVPPIVFMTMVNDLIFERDLKDRIVSLIELKSGKSESYMHPAEKELAAFITSELNAAAAAFHTLPGRKEKNIELDLLFRQIVKTQAYDHTGA